MFILGLSTMVWHMFIVKKLSSAAFLMDKVMFLIISVISFLVDIFGPPEFTPQTSRLVQPFLQGSQCV